MACSLLLTSNLGMNAVTSSGLRVLTADTDTPVVTETTMKAAALHTLHILTKALVQEICVLLGRLAILHVTLTIEHPRGDLELQRVADDCDDLIDLVCCELTSTLAHVDVAFLADDVGEASADTLDFCQCKHHLLSPIHICVAHTQNVLKVLRLELDRHSNQSALCNQVFTGRICR